MVDSDVHPIVRARRGTGPVRRFTIMKRMAETTPSARPRVVMIVNNDVATDNRVKKTAVAVSRAGVEVIILGFAPEGRRIEAMIGDVRVIRVPVQFRLRDADRRARARRRAKLPHIAYRTNEDAAAALLRLHVRQLEVKAESGHAAAGARHSSSIAALAAVEPTARLAARRTRLEMLRAGRFGVRGRRWLQRRIDQWHKDFWRYYDAGRNRVGVASWRHVVPEIDDYELAYGPVLDELAPDVIHAHDYHMLGIAHRAVGRARLRGRDAKWIYDAHEYTRGLSRYGGRTPRIIAAWADLEAEYIGGADAVITVSESIAEALQRDHHLSQKPTVVLNIPTFPLADSAETPSLRAAAGVADDVPLVVYGGGVTSARGVQTVIEALRDLPGVHFAVVAVPAVVTPYVQSLLDRASELGVADRVHVVPPVDAHHVVPYLSSATLGVNPILHFPSHDMALPNKLFEYLHARLPIVTSDCRDTARFVTEHGFGEVFAAGDAHALADAVRRVLGDRDRYIRTFDDRVDLLETYSWEHQADLLRGVYAELVGADRVTTHVEGLAPDVVDLRPVPVVPVKSGTVLAIGPANMAGQAWAWAKAAERCLPGVHTEVVAVQKETLNFPSDTLVSAATFARDAAWQMKIAQHAAETYTHVLLEAGRPLIGTLHGRDFAGDVPFLRDAGITVGLVFHGSEIRDPRRHRELYPFSPFADPEEALTARLQRQVDVLAPLVEKFDGPKFVSTPDLLDDVAGAIWLPVVVDTEVWRPVSEPPLQRRVPVVVHAPSNKALKGTHLIEPVLERLQDDGLIEYRRIENVPPADVPKFVADADIVLDHFGIGNYGVMTCQAMAMGRVSVSHIHERVRSRVPTEIPTIEATPDDLADVVRRILDDREWARALAAGGPAFVAAYHDGRKSAEVLARFLGVELS